LGRIGKGSKVRARADISSVHVRQFEDPLRSRTPNPLWPLTRTLLLISDTSISRCPAMDGDSAAVASRTAFIICCGLMGSMSMPSLAARARSFFIRLESLSRQLHSSIAEFCSARKPSSRFFITRICATVAMSAL